MNPFASLGLGSEIVSALTEQGYENPTPIQAAAIPKALAGHDLLAAAQTGTGKTAAFMLPSLERLKRYATSSTSPAMHPVRMLVLTPTRELADQIDQNVQGYIKNLPLRHTVLFGGVNMDKQTADLRAGCEIVVATVGRLLDHVKQKNINLNKVEIVALDEADRMLDMGFIDDIRKIMQMLPKPRQTLLFSATFAPPIRKLAKDFMNAPEIVEVAAQNTTSANVEQHIIAVDALKKRNLLERLIVDLQMNQVIVFCKTKQSVDQVTRDLVRRNLAAQSIHGDKSQQSRLETLNAFKEGRAGADGGAISLMDKTEQKMCEAIKELTGNNLAVERIEGFEPNWWGADADGDTADTQATPTRSRGSDRNRSERSNRSERNDRNERNDRGDKSPKADKTDPGAACGTIAGRSRRSRRERQPCALLQPNFGAK